MSEAFEEIVAVLLESDGYWVKRNIKIHLSSERQTALGLKSGACELDIVAVRTTGTPEILIVECKSFARSDGVDWKTFSPPVAPIIRRHRYKMFFSVELRSAITSLLTENGITPPNVRHTYCLASAATRRSDHEQIKCHLIANEMQFFDRAWLMERFDVLGKSETYQNNIVATMASLYHASSDKKYL